MVKIKLLFCVLFAFGKHTVLAQETDTLKPKVLNTITVQATRMVSDIKRQEPVVGTLIYSGKKTEVIKLSQKDVAFTEKYGRQIFAKIPGVFVYDMDGTGNQLNISTRGLDAHRGWEFNIRKDGVITNSDMYGYPASHYNIPMEAVERIELVRGTGSLQYGAQFGGMLNYVSKQPVKESTFAFESINTVGSYGLVSTYNGASGTLGKVSYSAWFNKKWLSGYRDASNSEFNAEAISLFFEPNSKIKLKLDWTHSNYITQLPGPLTDSMFYANPKMATRTRNYYNPNIHVPSVTVNFKFTSDTELQLISSAVLGRRNSVMFDYPATIPDSINSTTLQYSNRKVDIDQYNSYTTEVRLMHAYTLHGLKSNAVAGFQYMNNDLHRQQSGLGTTGSDFDLTLVAPGFLRDLNFKTKNMALFVENRWVLSPRLSINTGARLEFGHSDLSGRINAYPEEEVPNTIAHQFPLFCLNAQYNLSSASEFYAGWSQAYRPVLLKDIVPNSSYEFTDRELKDAYGSNVEAGFRGKWKILQWDASFFGVSYRNRMGTLAEEDSNSNFTIYRTNIGDAKTYGIELFLQADFMLGNKSNLSVFTSTAFMDARYTNATIRSGKQNIAIHGNRVESTPPWISRNGLTFRYAVASVSVLYSYTAASFADALNTVLPSATGSIGLVPAYALFDINFGIRLNERFRMVLNVNNALNKSYFTKRPQFYPGPGIWPSDGRTVSLTLFIKV
jgi:Fe(3+) dicitrate transport protein